MSRRIWPPAFWSVVAFLAVLALAWLARPVLPALGASQPVNPALGIAGLVSCRRDIPVPALKLGEDGRMLVSHRDRRGCVWWVSFVPQIRGR